MNVIWLHHLLLSGTMMRMPSLRGSGAFADAMLERTVLRPLTSYLQTTQRMMLSIWRTPFAFIVDRRLHFTCDQAWYSDFENRLHFVPSQLQHKKKSAINTNKVLQKSSSPLPMAAKWQYRNDDFKFVDFTKKDTAELEKAWARNDASIKLTIRGHPYTLDLKLFVQRNEETKTERIIRRVDPDSKTGGAHVWGRGPQWEWESHHGVFVPYDAATNDIIETAFSKDAIRAQIKLDVSAHEKKSFVVHFGHMHQENEEGTGVRKVRRSIKDIAPAAAAIKADEEETTSRQAVLAAAAASKKRPRDEPEAASSAVDAAPALPSTGGGGVPSSAPLPQLGDWLKVNGGSVLVLPVAFPASTSPIKIAGFDMDDTLVFPASGAVFAKSRTDWKWLCPEVVPKLLEYHNNGYRIVIFSNQSGIGGKGWDEGKANEIRGKIVDISAACKIPIAAVISTKEDEFRKPCTEMWDIVYREHCCLKGANIDKASSFYCGDAAGRAIMTLAGRKKDFSCSDRKFAYNLGVKFFTPEEIFKRAPAAPVDKWHGPSPDLLNSIATAYPQSSYHSASQEMVIMMGYPGSGKSTFYQRFFGSQGYAHVNRDTLKTPEKCMAAADAFLGQKKSVVVDNTNPTAEDRKRYVDIARKHGVPVRCFVMEANEALANHMNVTRARLGITDRVSSIAYRVYGSKVTAPDAAKEGFVSVVSIPPVADFTGLPPTTKALFYQLT